MALIHGEVLILNYGQWEGHNAVRKLKQMEMLLFTTFQLISTNCCYVAVYTLALGGRVYRSSLQCLRYCSWEYCGCIVFCAVYLSP